MTVAVTADDYLGWCDTVTKKHEAQEQKVLRQVINNQSVYFIVLLS